MIFKMFGLGDKKLKIKLLNTSSGEKEIFKPLHKNEVKIYACGPTVYDHMHIGNLRAYLLPDLLKRLFEYQGYDVSLTINFTDFGHLTDDADAGEDKIMKGMKRDGYAVTLPNMIKFAEQYIESFKADNLSFGNLPATNYTRASDYIEEQKKLIETLWNKGYAYETSDGVYFDIQKYPQYGVLGNVDISAIKAGSRVEINPEKKHPADFALWKKADLGWESRFGTGFPGWHIECTAMIFATLGEQIDIHTGGEDLKYTHHNAEIAQAECATGKKYVNYWLHNAHVTIADQKFAKSAGNSIRLVDLIEKNISPYDYRYWLLQSHYRSPVNFSFEALEAAKQAMTRLRRLVYIELSDVTVGKVNQNYKKKLLSTLNDDLSTPQSLALLWDLEKDSAISPSDKLATVRMFNTLLGLGLDGDMQNEREKLGLIEKDNIPEEINILTQEREMARKNKDWEQADELRDKIFELGYIIEDTSEGPQISGR